MIDFLNQKMRRLTVWDVGLVKWAVFFFAIIMVKLAPVLLNISYPALIILVAVLSARPFYRFWIRK
jgi:hypothetical protein